MKDQCEPSLSEWLRDAYSYDKSKIPDVSDAWRASWKKCKEIYSPNIRRRIEWMLAKCGADGFIVSGEIEELMTKDPPPAFKGKEKDAIERIRAAIVLAEHHNGLEGHTPAAVALRTIKRQLPAKE